MDDVPLDSFFNTLTDNETKTETAKLAEASDDEEDEILDDGDKNKNNSQPYQDNLADNEINSHLVKNIYIPAPEISSKTDEQIKLLRKQLGNITVHGLNVPCPITNWNQCGLPAPIVSLLEHRNFIQPTPIQCQVIPCVLSGRDIIGCAVTGSGKTLAFVIPCLLHVLAQDPVKQNETAAVILSPTRELAIQTHLECQKFFGLMGMSSACLVGGHDIEQQLKSVKNGAQVIIATPGRFIDLIGSNKAFNFSRVGFLVVDEADRMFDLGFEPQVMRIAEKMRPDRQTLMFSATFPHSVERVARKLLTSSIDIVVGVRNTVSAEVEQHVLIIPETEKFKRLLYLIGKYMTRGQTLVFTNTQSKAEELFGNLNKNGYASSMLHAGMQQSDRASILHDFREGVFNVLVLTSVGARGIDIPSIVLVVNYDAPDHEADYIHRIGRTGRAGKQGFAYTFITDLEVDAAAEIRNALKASKTPIPPELDALCGNKQTFIGKRGFKRGSGFKFDKSESEALMAMRKATAGEGVSETDEDNENENDLDIPKSDDSIKKLRDGLFMTEFVINGFPQLGRVAVTKKEVINEISDETGVSVTQRGIFCPPGMHPPKGEKPLYLLIEGPSKFAIQAAVSRLEEVAKDADPTKSKMMTKYKV